MENKWTRTRVLDVIKTLQKHSDYEKALAEIGETKDALYSAFKRFNFQPPSSYLGQSITVQKTAADWKTIIVTNDHHVPFHNKKGVENVLNFVSSFQPDILVFNGDFLDCYSISDFDVAPGMPSLQDEVDEGKIILKQFRAKCPGARMIYMEGNHEQRLERVVMRNPGFHKVEALTIRSLLGLDELGIEHRRYQEILAIGPLAIKHGEAVSANSGSTVMNEILRKGFSHVIIGHVHRLGWVHRKGYEGFKQGLENGGLFDIAQCHYNKNPDWQNGFCVVHVNEALKKVHIEPIWMDPDGSFFYGGVYYAT